MWLVITDPILCIAYVKLIGMLSDQFVAIITDVEWQLCPL